MDVAHNLIVSSSIYIYSKLLMILFWKDWFLLKVAFFWKTTLVIVYAKILHHSFIPTIYENFESIFFYLSDANKNLETYPPVWFDQLKE